MVKDAELNASEDKKKLELIQARNAADAMVHSVRKSLAELGDKLEAPEREKIEAAIKDAEEALKGDDKASIEAKTEALMTASQKLGEKVYAQTRRRPAAPSRVRRTRPSRSRRPTRPATTTSSTPSSRKSRRAERPSQPVAGSGRALEARTATGVGP